MPNTLRIVFFFLLLLTSINTALAASKPTQTLHQYPSGSWALGVVVPENSRFTDGGRLSWTNTTTVSVTIRLPNISFTDYPILAVESLMAADGSVMQIAAGIYPNQTNWLAYGWYIRQVQAYPQSYEWILNSSEPEMAAGTPISLSIYLSQGRWRYSIEDLTTHLVRAGFYGFDIPPALKVGDQEVFALESYSTSNAVFVNMGNLTLDSLRIDARQVSSGWYAYGSWDVHHSPLFVVGGLDPPSYMSLQKGEGATLVWSYQQWSGPSQTQPQTSPLAILIGLPAAAAIAVLTIAYFMKRRSHD